MSSIEGLIGPVAQIIDPWPRLARQALDRDSDGADALTVFDALQQGNFAVDILGLLALDLHAGLPGDEAQQQDGKQHEDQDERCRQPDG